MTSTENLIPFRLITIYIFTLIFLFLAGCGSGKTVVMEPVTEKSDVSTIGIVAGKSTVNIPDDVVNKFHKKLEQLLYDEGKFIKGADLIITYRFIQYDEGNQFTRWFWGGIGNAGEGAITVEAIYSNASENNLAKIQSEGKIGSGFFGGDFSLAVEKAAEEIADYTITNFNNGNL